MLVLNTTITGLQTFSMGCPDTSVYTVQVSNTTPSIITNGTTPSALVTTIKHGSSTVYTSNPGDLGAFVEISAASGDTISVITSSTSTVDSAINAVKSTISVSEGNI